MKELTRFILTIAFALSSLILGPANPVFAQSDPKQEVANQESSKQKANQQETAKSSNRFRSDEGGFQLQFENPIHTVRRLQPRPGSKTELHMFVSSSNEGQNVQSLSFHDLAQVPADKDYGKVFKSGIDGFRQSISGKILSEKALKNAELPAREIQFEATHFGKKVRGAAHWVIRKNRVYQLTHVETADRFDPSRAEAFFSSLKMVEIVKPKPKPKPKPENKPPAKKADDGKKPKGKKGRGKVRKDVPKDAKKGGV